MPFGFIKTEVNLPQEYVTAVDIGYPVDAFLGFIKTEINLPQEYVTAVDIGYHVDAFWVLLKLRSICLRNMLQQ